MARDDELSTAVSGRVSTFVGEDDTGPLSSNVRLLCVSGADLGRSFRLQSDSVTLGRGNTADIQLKATNVSRHHARIARSRDRFTLTDLGSANGTFVNGTPVKDVTTLAFGDRIQVGSTILLFARHDELEERMRRVQRLEAMGTFAGGLAHDFNNALSVISGNLQLLRMRLPAERAEELQMIEEMLDATNSAAGLAQRLLRLGRTEAPVFEDVNLANLVERAISAMRRQGGGNMSISARVPPDLAVRGSYEELYQVLINLIVNARDAMPDGGSLRMQARMLDLDTGSALERQLPGSGEYVELDVADTGVGMDEATLARVFEPFFTTKPAGKGTGLGLAMVHGIVRRHGGAITVESIAGSGTTIRIVLPSVSAG